MSRETLKPSRMVRITLAVAIAGFLAMAGLGAQQSQQIADPDLDGAQIHVEPVRGNIYMLAGAGGNITVSVGPDGALLVDTGVEQMADSVLATIQEIARVNRRGRPGLSTPIRYIINTSIDPDHTGGNLAIAESSAFDPVSGGERIIAQGNLVRRLSDQIGGQSPQLYPGLPTEAYFTPYYKLGNLFNGEGIQLFHMPGAHSDGDSIVWFRGSDVISIGDIIRTTEYPVIDVEKGGSVQGLVEALNFLLDLAYPGFRGQGGTILIPGHGYLLYSNNIAFYRDMVTIVRDRIQNLITKGMTLEQIQAAKPTTDYDPVYGRNSGSSERFVEAVYRSLDQEQ